MIVKAQNGAWNWARIMHPWRQVAFSERGTLAAIAVGAILLVIRQLVS